MRKKTDLFAGLAKCCFDCSYQGPSCDDIDDIEADLKRKEMECIDPVISDFFDVFSFLENNNVSPCLLVGAR